MNFDTAICIKCGTIKPDDNVGGTCECGHKQFRYAHHTTLGLVEVGGDLLDRDDCIRCDRCAEMKRYDDTSDSPHGRVCDECKGELT